MTSSERLGKYEILETLGRGAMGVVYKGFDPGIDRTVAIKTVRKELIEDDDRAGMALARFRNEARAAGRLSHPGIVAVYDYGESDAVTYIAMEYVQGNSLREYFNRGTRFSEPDIVSIMAQLLDALQHAHDAGVWHRDIKPANLIIMSNGRLKIADFGIARIETSQLTQTGMVMGSPGYMAPEQYAGGAVDFRADLFAAGVVMHQLLTGSRLFTGSAEQVAYKICHQDAPAPSAVDPGKGWERYDAVVARALAKDPAQRHASARAFRDAIVGVYAAPANVAISEETVIAAPTMPAAMFEPSNPSARTGDRAASASGQPGPAIAIPPPLPPPPIGASPAPGAAATPAVRRWPVLVGALSAVVIGAVIGGWWVQRARVPIAKPEPLAAASPTPETKPVEVARPSGPAKTPTAPPPPAATTAPPPISPLQPARKAPEPAVAAKKKPQKEAAVAATPKPTAPRRVEPTPAAIVQRPLTPSPLGQDAATAPASIAEHKRPTPEPVAAAAPAVPATPAAAPQPEPQIAPPPEPSVWRDQGITMKVASKIQFNRRLWSSGIQVETVAGVVTLRGNVGSQALSAEAEKLAAAVYGVVSVKNEIKITP
ncbi:MAG: protein kinase [Betaproteobacteria bacterium]|nr:protein kinase [Betaproteobacteria bacterium]